jgi:hypothetical protein
MAVLQPYFTKKHVDKAPRLKEILAKGDLRKASIKVVPRLRAEMEAGDLLPEVGETLEALEKAVQTSKDAKETGEEEQEALDRAEALLQDARDIQAKAKAVQEELARSRYRSMPDQVHKEVQEISTRFNVVNKALSRLRGPDQNPAPSAANRVVVEEGVRGLKVRQYISAPFSGEGPQARRDFALWRAEWRDAEAAMRAKKGTAADFFNRLQPALQGQAL